jgi:methionine sulfoxide reductase heme-binding subunit
VHAGDNSYHFSGSLQEAFMKAVGWSKVVLFPVCLVPVGLLGLGAYRGELGANPLEVITHATGDWTIRFLLITLCVTPLRQITKFYWLIQYRRMLGLFAFFYGTLHLTTYLWFDKFFVWHDIWADIAKRKFITVGFLAFLLMVPLAVTSTKGMIRRLGKKWVVLHRLIYVSAGLGVVHYYWLVKADHRLPLAYGVGLLFLLGYRVVRALGPRLAGRVAVGL